jgi:hypothetical protein
MARREAVEMEGKERGRRDEPVGKIPFMGILK